MLSLTQGHGFARAILSTCVEFTVRNTWPFTYCRFCPVTTAIRRPKAVRVWEWPILCFCEQSMVNEPLLCRLPRPQTQRFWSPEEPMERRANGGKKEKETERIRGTRCRTLENIRCQSQCFSLALATTGLVAVGSSGTVRLIFNRAAACSLPIVLSPKYSILEQRVK